MGRALFTDYYELNMAASYLRRGMTAPGTFSLFVRKLPPERGFLVAAGLEDCLDWLEGLAFDDDDLSYLRRLGFAEGDVAALGRLRFTGEVWAVPEGRIVFADEPLLEVTAPMAEAQLAETFLLNQITVQTTLASKAARCRLAAGEIELVEFGFRRTHGVDAAMAAARVAAMVGFAGTSNVEAARHFGLQPMGTMAHSYIEAFPTEVEAFRSFAADLPDRAIFLVDTYDTLQGVRQAAEVIRQLGLERVAGIRLDSGDLLALSQAARQVLDASGLHEVRIFVSGGLDEYELETLVAGGAPVDAAGVGTRLGVSADAPYLDTAYKLVSYGDKPVLKLSPGKSTLPGAKQVFRAPGLEDCIGLRQEPTPQGSTALLKRVMANGRRVAGAPDRTSAIAAARRRFEEDLADLPERARALRRPQAPVPRHSATLEQLAATVRSRYRSPSA
ncbi:MAG TPA: nicotinate phosphoribosyltransferase [Acidimicrobiales bacterium]|nr:nicotinate phosphoribosyltransferase [Acidimicrobiales bacterium]